MVKKLASALLLEKGDSFKFVNLCADADVVSMCSYILRYRVPSTLYLTW